MSFVHASVELLEAMRGVAPMPGSAAVDPRATLTRTTACDGRCLSDADRSAAWAKYGGNEDDDVDVVDCPACLAAIFRAMDPMRLDTLLERGDLKPLEGM